MTPDDIGDEDIKNLIEENLSEAESAEKDLDELVAVGSLLVERAVLVFSGTRTPEQLVELEKFLDQHESKEDLLDRLLEQYPEFVTVLAGEVENYRNEIKKTLGEEVTATDNT